VFLPRLAQMRVQIDEAGRSHESRGINCLDIGSFDFFCYVLVKARDRTVLDQDVEIRIDLLRRIDDARSCNQQIHSVPCAAPRR
jgi:hypothetical protein